jgi:hypothetical protein
VAVGEGACARRRKRRKENTHNAGVRPRVDARPRKVGGVQHGAPARVRAHPVRGRPACVVWVGRWGGVGVFFFLSAVRRRRTIRRGGRRRKQLFAGGRAPRRPSHTICRPHPLAFSCLLAGVGRAREGGECPWGEGRGSGQRQSKKKTTPSRAWTGRGLRKGAAHTARSLSPPLSLGQTGVSPSPHARACVGGRGEWAGGAALARDAPRRARGGEVGVRARPETVFCAGIPHRDWLVRGRESSHRGRSWATHRPTARRLARRHHGHPSW